MPDPAHDQYDLEPDEARSGGGDDVPRLGRKPDIERSSGLTEPLKVESRDDATASRSSVRDLDICPSCGGSMRGSDDLVCIRCGFDLKTMKHVRTTTGEAVVSAPGEVEDEAAEAIVKPGNGDYWLPGIIAGICGLALLIGYLAGMQGLFPAITEIRVGVRFLSVLQMLVLSAMLTACGLGALAFLAHLVGMRFARHAEGLQLAAVRMLAIVLAMQLAQFISLPQRALEWTLETLVQLAIFAGLSIALFRLKPRDVPTLTGALVILFVVLWAFAKAVVWATE